MIGKIDYNVAEFFHKIYTWGGSIANAVMEGISFVAEAGILFLLIGLGLALFKRTRKVGGAILLAVALGFLITNITLKNVVERARPFENVSSDYYKWWLDAGATYEGGYSFPSGHTTATTAFAVAIFLSTNKKYSCWILMLPIAMASSRIYLMVHYFTDCLGGLLVGTICGALAYWIMSLIYKSRAKLFAWIQDFEVFRFKQSKSASNPKIASKKKASKNNVKDVNTENLVYTTQAEEKAKQEQISDTSDSTADKEQSNTDNNNK